MEIFRKREILLRSSAALQTARVIRHKTGLQDAQRLASDKSHIRADPLKVTRCDLKEVLQNSPSRSRCFASSQSPAGAVGHDSAAFSRTRREYRATSHPGVAHAS